MRTAPTFAVVAKAMVRPALWLCASNLMVTVLAAQCTNPTQVPSPQTISSGTVNYSDNNALAADAVVINGSASVTFVAGNCIELRPGFHATAGTAGTTFHGWVETAPSVISVSPSSGSGLSQQFTWTVSSPSGYANLAHVQALFNTSVFGANSCYIYYTRASNLLYLADDSGGHWTSGGIVPGTSGTAGNSQCTIYASGSSVSASGNQLALTVSVAFQTSFSGTKNNYLNADDNEGLYSPWLQMGTWTVGSAQQYSLTTAVGPSGGGSTTPTCPSGCLYGSGSQVQITATPAAGYQFSGFTGTVNSGSNPLTVTVNSAMTETANFTAAPTADFTLDLPASVQVEAGFQNSLRLRITPQNGFNAQVSWTLTPGVSGVTAATALNSQYPLTTATGTLYALASVPAGTYSLTVQADGGGKSHSANITMQVVRPYRAQSESSMSFVVFLTYDNNHFVDSLPVLKQICGAGAGMRACYQQIMDSYRAQQISGVRVMFSLADAIVYADGSVNQTWLAGLRAFFEDLYNRQIYRITPTPSWDHPSFDGPYVYRDPVSLAGCTDPYFYSPDPQADSQRTVTQVRFNRTAPFSEAYVRMCDRFGNNCTESWQTDGEGRIAAYQCAMANPNFVGWDRMFDVIDDILLAARDNYLTVQEFDVTNEIQLSGLPVRGRLIVDNTNQVPGTSDDVDVLGTVGSGRRSLRQSMQDHGFDPGRVTYSVIGGNPQQALGECPPDNPAYFGDSGRINELSLLTAVIGTGGPVGISWNYDLAGSGLACSASTAGAPALAYTHVQPTIIDVHNGPCVVVPITEIGFGECDPGQWSYLAGEATAMGNALAAFQDSFRATGWRGLNSELTNALLMLGETHGRGKPGDPAIQADACRVADRSADFTACSMQFPAANPRLDGACWKVSAVQDTYGGFNSSNLGYRTRPNGLPASIVFRPWEYLQQTDDPQAEGQANACNTISTNPPYIPMP